MKDEIEEILKDLRYALSKFNWGASALDAAAVKTLNEYESRIRNAFDVLTANSAERYKGQHWREGYQKGYNDGAHLMGKLSKDVEVSIG